MLHTKRLTRLDPWGHARTTARICCCNVNFSNFGNFRKFTKFQKIQNFIFFRIFPKYFCIFIYQLALWPIFWLTQLAIHQMMTQPNFFSRRFQDLPLIFSSEHGRTKLIYLCGFARDQPRVRRFCSRPTGNLASRFEIRERESTPGGNLVPGRTTNPHCRSGINKRK